MKNEVYIFLDVDNVYDLPAVIKVPLNIFKSVRDKDSKYLWAKKLEGSFTFDKKKYTLTLDSLTVWTTKELVREGKSEAIMSDEEEYNQFVTICANKEKLSEIIEKRKAQVTRVYNQAMKNVTLAVDAIGMLDKLISDK